MKNFFMKSLFLIALYSIQSFGAIENQVIITDVKDVETLNDNLSKYIGKTIRVEGEITSKLDANSAILESGGIFDDEIVIIASPNLKGRTIESLPTDSQVTVIGTIVTKPVTEVSTDLTWNITTALEKEFTNVNAFLLADEIIQTTR